MQHHRSRMVVLFVLAAVILFGTSLTAPTAAQACPVAVAVAAETGSAGHVISTPGGHAGVISLWAAPAAPSGDGGCGRDAGGTCSSGCCVKIKCPLADHGVAPGNLQPAPPLSASLASLPSGLLSEGIGTLPALRPPRASV